MYYTIIWYTIVWTTVIYYDSAWRARERHAAASPKVSLRWRLPDGVRTNGVVTEVPQFPLMNFHRKMCAKCANVCALKTNCGKMQGNVALLWKPRLFRPRLEAGDSGSRAPVLLAVALAALLVHGQGVEVPGGHLRPEVRPSRRSRSRL